MYADILNVRFSQWIDENNIVVDEQNGFRRNRSCLEHIYALYTVIYTVINKQKQQNNLRLFALWVLRKHLIPYIDIACGKN